MVAARVATRFAFASTRIRNGNDQRLGTRSDVAKIFSQLEARKAELHINHWGLTHTSLEEVFLRLVAEAATQLKQTAMMVPPQQPKHAASSAVLPTVQDV